VYIEIKDILRYFFLYSGLINFARKNLKKGGRLVFLFPVYEDEEYKGI
jgi:tRNA G10  N-methylase Trm11